MSLWKRLGAANTVTVLRILFIPVFLGIMLVDWPSLFADSNGALYELRTWLAALMFVLLAATDAIDGYLARSRNEVTTFGKFIDPLADKILVTAALVALIQTGVLPAWIALVIITREFVVSGLRMIASAEGIVIAASWYGKVKTILQIVAVVMFILKDSEWAASLPTPLPTVVAGGAWVVMGGAVVMTILSMVDYFAGASHVLVGPWTVGEGSGSEESQTGSSAGAGATAVSGAVAGHESASPSVSELAAAAVLALRTTHRTVAVAESLTGGLVMAALTSVPGASAVVAGGVVTYTDDAKATELAVDRDLLKHESATSSAVAQSMAVGARERFGTDIGVSTTGNAGPDSQGAAAVGTYFVAVATADGVSVTKIDEGEIGRDAVRSSALTCALSSLQDVAKG